MTKLRWATHRFLFPRREVRNPEAFPLGQHVLTDPRLVVTKLPIRTSLVKLREEADDVGVVVVKLSSTHERGDKRKSPDWSRT